MKDNEIDIFIEEMEKIGDLWTADQVRDVYGDTSLEDALNNRKGCIDSFFDIIGKVINR